MSGPLSTGGVMGGVIGPQSISGMMGGMSGPPSISGVMIGASGGGMMGGGASGPPSSGGGAAAPLGGPDIFTGYLASGAMQSAMGAKVTGVKSSDLGF